MNSNWLERTKLLIGNKNQTKLKHAHILIVGLGGVGSFAAEFITRAGIGKLTIVDGDVVDITNVNRQLPALNSTVDKSKVDIVGDRLIDINPSLRLRRVNEFLEPERIRALLESEKFDFVMDCIDSLKPKEELIFWCKRLNIKVISSMGAGGKLDPSKVMVRDLSKTYNCMLAQKLRKRLKKRLVDKGVRAVFSSEQQIPDSLQLVENGAFKKSFYGTISYMPALFGLYAASDVIRYLMKSKWD